MLVLLGGGVGCFDLDFGSDDPTVGNGTACGRATTLAWVGPCFPGAMTLCSCADDTTRIQACTAEREFEPCPCDVDDAGRPVARDVPVAADATAEAPPVSLPPPDRRTYDYVIHAFALDPYREAPSNRGFYGFNLDGRFSPARTASQAALDCSHGDFFSVLDPDQNRGRCVAGMAGGGPGCEGGVDNQYPSMVQTLEQFQASVGIQVCLSGRSARGRGLILLRVGEVDGTPGPGLNDPEVSVRFYPDAVPLFGNCTEVALANRHYAIDDRALRVAGDPDSARLRFTGSIVNGRLRVAAAGAMRFPLALGFGVASNIRAFQLRVSLSERAGTLGNLGGYVDQTELINMFVSDPAFSNYRDAAGPLIQGFVDVATPNGDAGVSCESPAGGIAVGLGFTAVRAVIAATAAGSVPGMCGSARAP